MYSDSTKDTQVTT